MFRLRTAQKKFRNVAFSPSALFQTGDILLWYDPSDLTTMFKDTAGTQPVTADGDSVALMLDKGQWGGKTLEQVLAAQTELVTNGTFADATGWTLGSGWAVGSGVLTGASIAVGGAQASFAATIVAGRAYRVTYTITAISANGVSLQVGGTNGTSRTSAGTYTEIITATNTTAPFFAARVGTTTVSVDNVSVKLIPGYHRIQATGTSMPKYKTDGTLHWLLYDGTDDGHATGTITWGTDEVASCFGGTKSSDAAAQVVFELSPTINANTGAFYLVAGTNNITGWTAASRGTATSGSGQTAGVITAAPDTRVVTSTHDISADRTTIRVDGVDGTPATADKGTGNFGSYPLYFGRRGGTTLPFNGREYQTVIRSRLLSAAELSSLETFIAAKTGVIL